MSAKNTGLDRAADELAKGRVWRAKEILSGKLRDAPYDADLFKAYADVLLAMRDEREAGKFYWLAGMLDGPGAELARDFVDRSKVRSLQEFWSTLPSAARRMPTAQALPASSKSLLTSCRHDGPEVDHFVEGIVRTYGAKKQDASAAKKTRSSFSNRGQIAGIVGLGAILVLLVLGVFKLAEIGILAVRLGVR